MVKQVLQIENITAEEFTNKLSSLLNNTLENHKKTIKDNDDEILVSRQEAASLFGVSLVTIWDWSRKGIISGFRIGNKVVYKKSELLECLKKINN